MKKRSTQHLSQKLENILPLMIKLIKHADYKLVKEKFPLPTKEETTRLYTYDPSLPFYQGLFMRAANSSILINIILGKTMMQRPTKTNLIKLDAIQAPTKTSLIKIDEM
jgi:hypothetical protein